MNDILQVLYNHLAKSHNVDTIDAANTIIVWLNNNTPISIIVFRNFIKFRDTESNLITIDLNNPNALTTLDKIMNAITHNANNPNTFAIQ